MDSIGRIVIPGDCVASTSKTLLNGYGIYKHEGVLYASLMGKLEQVVQIIFR